MSEFFKQQDCNVIGSEWIEGKLCNSISVGTHAISRDKANRLIKERAQVVTSYFYGPGPKVWSHDIGGINDTHRALLICVEPLISDSAEKILSGFVALIDEELNRVGPKTRALYDRAKKLRGGK